MDNKEKLLNLYVKVNEMMSFLGMEGEITTRSPFVDEVMDALYNIDDGEYLPIRAARFIESINKQKPEDKNQGKLF